MTLKQRLDAYERLMRLNQPIGALLLLWPALWGLWLSRRSVPEFDVLAIFLLGVVVMRSAGCVINDYADRNFDPHVERTRNRPLASDALRPAEALALAGVLLLGAFFLVLQLNWLAVSLSFVALGLTVIYPFLKRFFPFPQAWLGEPVQLQHQEKSCEKQHPRQCQRLGRAQCAAGERPVPRALDVRIEVAIGVIVDHAAG